MLGKKEEQRKGGKKGRRRQKGKGGLEVHLPRNHNPCGSSRRLGRQCCVQ
jgi:hypothetical protein